MKAIWGTIREGRNPQRERIVAQVRRSIRRTPGDPVAGQAVFDKLCPSATRSTPGAGRRPGPHRKRPQRLRPARLQRLRPEPRHRAGYQATTLATADCLVLTGLLAEDGKDRIVLKIQGGS